LTWIKKWMNPRKDLETRTNCTERNFLFIKLVELN
jgi:hypothetical protein